MAAANDAFNALGPYQGRTEGHSRIMLGLALLLSGWSGILPWAFALRILLHAHHRADSLSAALVLAGAPRLPWLLLFDWFGLIGAFHAIGLYRSLGKRIRVGGPDADYLDQVRMRLASLCVSGAFLFFCLMVPVGRAV
ncbi:hypothetical protein [Acidipila sp. EB88]|uniref:hypothetical protein n=1 Tax=Acidipila sp. EB88 TaxID=2305226 RepID=UPI000F5EF2AF|nr:hypothetical protein [Acidipila sp. EB88]